MSIYDLSTISLMSAPAANALSEPAIRDAADPGIGIEASTAASSSSLSAMLSAFKACGRLRRITPTRPRVSTMMVSVLMALPGWSVRQTCCHGIPGTESTCKIAGDIALRAEQDT